VRDVAEAVDILPRMTTRLQAQVEPFDVLIGVVERTQPNVHNRFENVRVVLQAADMRDRCSHCCC